MLQSCMYRSINSSRTQKKGITGKKIFFTIISVINAPNLVKRVYFVCDIEKSECVLLREIYIQKISNI
jgi:hypothetical protein